MTEVYQPLLHDTFVDEVRKALERHLKTTGEKLKEELMQRLSKELDRAITNVVIEIFHQTTFYSNQHELVIRVQKDAIRPEPEEPSK